MNITIVGFYHINETYSPVHVLLRQDRWTINTRVHRIPPPRENTLILSWRQTLKKNVCLLVKAEPHFLFVRKKVKKKDWRDLRLTATLKTGSCCQVQNKSI